MSETRVGSRKRQAEALEEATAIASLSSGVAGYHALGADEVALDRLLRGLAAELPDSAVSSSFLEQKAAYDASALLRVLRRMPKGAVLHTHGIATGDFRELARRVRASDSKLPDHRGRQAGIPRLPPDQHFPGPEPEPRRRVGARRHVGGGRDLPAAHPALWAGLRRGQLDKFFAIWDRLNGILGCAEFYYGRNGYMWHILEEQWKTGVWYLEIKESIFHSLKNLNGECISDDEWMFMFKSTVEEFKEQHPGFVGARAIMTFLKLLPEDDARQAFRRTVALKAKYPDYIAGFDLAGPEDHPNSSMFAEMFEEERSKSKEAEQLPLMIHAGETHVTAAQHHVEAVCMSFPGCRIGHGFALVRRPNLWPEVKQKGICLEVCPISNQVLGYFPQLAAHPAPTLLRCGLPMTISHDDPGIWHYSDVSYDWVAATKAWSLNLAEIKALARNSIIYSTLPSDEKAAFLSAWESAWQGWVREALASPGE
ncbi:unnamed protein product [Prorocentrum cordatum]|uniref:Adenosine deaminase domain-containing protein n=1 Tax=Prorocentrum cordatum TaxID=2364126 RepID=A0ABN9X438_9DINO|nr:unnamed protein product [Polarella glacialis]